MRRRRPVDDERPSWLLHYRPQDWTGKGCHPECAYWEAVDQWQAAHPDIDLPPGTGPDAPFHIETI
ncbi:hypothetical protein [Ornithinimicrobium cryptoxanthini]|uniref:hypothetical protein n=1 Tax=Ornithinimicrobium cryptoxanthini TaxID=2934161 RepID=UPI002117ADFF|nr:hypothetical protein [Ornithinimicrobium cryptoxanthini]